MDPLIVLAYAALGLAAGLAIGCVGIGLHSGRRVTLSLHPALPGSGITSVSRFRMRYACI